MQKSSAMIDFTDKFKDLILGENEENVFSVVNRLKETEKKILDSKLLIELKLKMELCGNDTKAKMRAYDEY